MEFPVPLERSFDSVYGLEHLGGDGSEVRGRLRVTDAVRGGVAGPAELVVLDARHAPHLEAPAATLRAAAQFISARS